MDLARSCGLATELRVVKHDQDIILCDVDI